MQTHPTSRFERSRDARNDAPRIVGHAARTIAFPNVRTIARQGEACDSSRSGIAEANAIAINAVFPHICGFVRHETDPAARAQENLVFARSR